MGCNQQLSWKQKGKKMKNHDRRYEQQFEYAKKVWQTSTGQKYTGTESQKEEIIKMVYDIKKLING